MSHIDIRRLRPAQATLDKMRKAGVKKVAIVFADGTVELDNRLIVEFVVMIRRKASDQLLRSWLGSVRQLLRRPKCDSLPPPSRPVF